MDEDDAIAIVTRRLVTEHKFFRSGSNQFESSRVKMSPGANVQPGSSHWTSLEMLYKLNGQFLMTPVRRNRGWGASNERLTEFIRFRPEEDVIDALAEELFRSWDSLVTALPVLGEDPSSMRDHGADIAEGTEDHVLFWPIVQELLVELARDLLDGELSRRSPEVEDLELPAAARALQPLSTVVWSAHRPPWRHLLLVRTENDDWRIASEDRKSRLRVAQRIVRWQLGLDQLSEEEITGRSGLRSAWRELLPLDAVHEVESMWTEIEEAVRT